MTALWVHSFAKVESAVPNYELKPIRGARGNLKFALSGHVAAREAGLQTSLVVAA